jgi:hypothetical protein
MPVMAPELVTTAPFARMCAAHVCRADEGFRSGDADAMGLRRRASSGGRPDRATRVVVTSTSGGGLLEESTPQASIMQPNFGR